MKTAPIAERKVEMMRSRTQERTRGRDWTSIVQQVTEQGDDSRDELG